MNIVAFLGAIFVFIAVALGAFGAHGLSDRLDDGRMKTYQTGVQYHLIHGTAAWVLGLFGSTLGHPVLLDWAGGLFLGGVVLFSGSLYLLALERLPRRLGLITPIGGLLFLVGWALLAIQAV